MNFKSIIAGIALALGISCASAQQPQALSGTPPFNVDAVTVNGGSYGGYYPKIGTGLVLNIGPGTSYCSTGNIVTYTGGTLTLTASSTNYVYLSVGGGCTPAFNTSGFSSNEITLATVITNGSSILTTCNASGTVPGTGTNACIQDDRTLFINPLASGASTGNVVNVGLLAAYGDSLTSGNEGVINQDNFPSLLQTYAGIQTINYGVGGTTSTQIAVRAGATPSSVQKSSNSGVIPACTNLTCSSITVAFPLGYEPTANSTTGGGGTVPVTGTIVTTPAIHGTVSLSLYQGTTTWSISGGTATINGLVLVAGSSVVPATGVAIEANGLTGATGCTDINGPHLLTGGTSSTASFATTCTGSGTGGVVSIYTFTPDSYTAGATISGTPVWNTDTPCPSCNVVAWPGRNNLFANGSYPAGISVVEGSVNALAAIVPAGKSFIVMPVIPENVPAEWSSGGNYATLIAYQTRLASNYPNSYVNVWSALQNLTATGCGFAALPTDAADVANGNIPTSCRAITATGTLNASVLSTDTAMQINVTQGILVSGQVVTLDVGDSTKAENVVCTVSGSSNPYSLSACTRGYGGSTPFAHSGGATINQDDATHLNHNGYAVVAKAIASHLGVMAGTSPATTPQLNRANTLGSSGVQSQTIGGGCVSGVQIVFGNNTSIQNSTGCVEAAAVTGSEFAAYNSKQNGGYGIDQWTQPLSTNLSYLSLMGLNGWGLYHALSAASDGPFSTFWSGPDVQLSRSAATFNVEAFFTTSANSFANNADAANTVIVQGGATADQTTSIEYRDKGGACKWDYTKPSTDNSARLFDCGSASSHPIYRFIFISDGLTSINSGFGANAVLINNTANSGTGGFVVQSGGATPITWASITSAGLTVPGIEAPGGLHYCLQVDQNGLFTNFGAACDSFAALTAGTNTTGAMLVGTGASLGPTGTGVVTANALTGAAAGTQNVSTLASGTVTVNNAAACTPSSTCNYKLTNCGINASTAIGTLTVGTVVPGTSFVINSESSAAAVVTGDASTVCWKIN